MKIGIISSYDWPLYIKEELEKNINIELVIRHILDDDIYKIAQELEREDKVRVIISDKIILKSLENCVNVPLVAIKIHNHQLLNLFTIIKQYGKSIMYIGLIDELKRQCFEIINENSEHEVVYFDSGNIDDIDTFLKEHNDFLNEIMVTEDSLLAKKAEALGMKVFRIYPDKFDLKAAIEIAVNNIKIINEEIHKNQWIREIIEVSDDGILILDDAENVTFVNKRAEEICEIQENQMLGRNLSDMKKKDIFLKHLKVLDEDVSVTKFKGQEFVITCKRVFGHNKRYLGRFFRMQQWENLQKIELKARREISDKGFVADSKFDDIVGSSEVMKEAVVYAKRYAKTNANVFINGESGSGKDMFAQGIHNYSNRNKGPFIAINCAALPEQLLESELFGYEAGSFTGAKKDGKPGLLELAHGGTLFLDEIGEMPIHLQSRLLRALEDKSIRRIGGAKNIPINVRIISATNRNLMQEIKNGNFREDLYYRIKVLTLKLLPLRNRKEDIPELVEVLMRKLVLDNRTFVSIAEDAVDVLKERSWRGNIRELRNVLEHLIVLCDKDFIDKDMVNKYFESETVNFEEFSEIKSDTINVPISSIDEMEKFIIKEVYDRYGGDKKNIEKILKISSTTLWRRIKELGDI